MAPANQSPTPIRELALARLVHPLTLAAIALQLVNDHVLRRTMPGWWTGKLGDATMLVYAPVLFAALLALLVGGQGPRRWRALASSSIALTGVWYTLGKTWPEALAATNGLLSWITARPSHLILDPTDLLMLPLLGLAGHIMFAPPPQPIDRVPKPFALAALALAWLATVATSIPMQDFGIRDLCISGSEVWSNPTTAGRYVSRDGGRSWERRELDEGPTDDCPLSTDFVRADGRRYQIAAGEYIARSEDGGETWEVLVSLRPSTPSVDFAGDWNIGPWQTVYVAGHDSFVLGMGVRGVLLIEPDDDVRWVQVGPYRNRYSPGQHAYELLYQPRMAAAMLTLIAMAVFAEAVRPRKRWRAVLTWIAIALALFPAYVVQAKTAPGALAGTYWRGTLGFLWVVVCLPGMLIGAWGVARLARRGPRTAFVALGFAMVAALVYLVPFTLWAFTGYPGFSAQPIGAGEAPFLAIMVAILVMAGGYVHFRRTALPPTGATPTS